MQHPMSPRLLVVEEDADAASLMIQALGEQFGVDAVRRCPSMARALALDLASLDLVLTDMRLPDGSGLELLEKLLERRADLPVMVVTDEGIAENAVAAIRGGAYDYVVKAGDYLFALPLVVEKNLALHRTKQENLRLHGDLARTLEEVRVKNRQLEEAVAKLETAAATDPLTGLANRRAFETAFERAFAQATRHGHDLSCVMIDLDGFKQVNDGLGHRRGDDMLQRAAEVLEANCRCSDVAGRFGGDEFIVLLPRTDEPTASVVAGRIAEQFNALADRLLAAAATPALDASLAINAPSALDAASTGLEEDDPWRPTERLTMSLGLATLEQTKAACPEQLIEAADRALYRAKEAGKTRLMVHACA